MIVASYTLCEELFEKSGWSNTALRYGLTVTETEVGVPIFKRELLRADEESLKPDEDIPAYSLGYILQAIIDQTQFEQAGVLHMLADYVDADSFEDAACRLALDLLAKGLLERAA